MAKAGFKSRLDSKVHALKHDVLPSRKQNEAKFHPFTNFANKCLKKLPTVTELILAKSPAMFIGKENLC